MDFADGTLVVLADRLEISKVVSIDSDFIVYRKKNGWALKSILK